MVPDANFSFSDQVSLKAIQKFLDAKKEFLGCLRILGVKRESFIKCVGLNYSKVNRKLHSIILSSENELKEGFASNIEPVCRENKLLCHQLIESLNEDFMKGKDPSVHLQKFSEEYPLKIKTEKQLQQSLSNFQKNYKLYKNIEIDMEHTRDQIIDSIRDQIRELNLDVDYKYDFNPWEKVVIQKAPDIKIPVRYHSKFTEDLLKQPVPSEFQSYQKKRVPLGKMKIVV